MASCCFDGDDITTTMKLTAKMTTLVNNIDVDDGGDTDVDGDFLVAVPLFNILNWVNETVFLLLFNTVFFPSTSLVNFCFHIFL